MLERLSNRIKSLKSPAKAENSQNETSALTDAPKSGKKRELKEESKSEQNCDPEEADANVNVDVVKHENSQQDELEGSKQKVKSVRFQNGAENEEKQNKLKSDSKSSKAAKKAKSALKKSPVKPKKKTKKEDAKEAADKNDKRESKLEAQPFAACEERKWNDSKMRKMRTGAFNDREVILLRNAVCEYARENNLSNNELKALIDDTEKNKPYTRAWTEIAKALRKLWEF